MTAILVVGATALPASTPASIALASGSHTVLAYYYACWDPANFDRAL